MFGGLVLFMWVLNFQNVSLDMQSKAVERKWYFQDEGVSLTATPGSSMDGASRTGQQVMMIVMMIDRWEADFFCIIFLFVFLYFVFISLFSISILMIVVVSVSSLESRWETETFICLYFCISVICICVYLLFVFVYICICVFLFLFTFYSYDPGCVSVVPWETRRRQKWHAFAANGKTWHETQLTRLYFCICWLINQYFFIFFIFLFSISYIPYIHYIH